MTITLIELLLKDHLRIEKIFAENVIEAYFKRIFFYKRCSWKFERVSHQLFPYYK